MELDELKSAWNKVSSSEEKQRQLPEEEFRKILKIRTLDISDKIGRNIRIGVGIILAWVILGFATDFILTPLFKTHLNKPYLTENVMFWTLFLEAINYVLILSAIIIFWIRYSRIEKENINTSNLKSKLNRLIGILDSYKKMFYMVMVAVFIYISISFSTGFLMEWKYQIKQSGIVTHNLNFLNWMKIILAFTFTLAILIVIYYLLFNLFFKRLYGRYLRQLKTTLKELNETSEDYR